jgi:uncharacterized membrane protein YkvA (DUF1232 family)
VLSVLKARAKRIRTDLHSLYLAMHDPRTPWYAKALIVMITAYALSPIDLIPDFVPVLGYLDDLILIPAGIMLAIKLVPSGVLNDCRLRAGKCNPKNKSAARIAAVFIAAFWFLILSGLLFWGKTFWEQK